ncbi:YkvA family protein [Wenzhouxiangella sp. EGI_FJ10409]|uniref:YkvA family protein n=1 Tax=Wenzhouxiangella sp. EGI_FJ10409 TaxID=3243767 RepID=UPI0035DDB676
MSLKITLDFSEKDLERFRDMARKAMDNTREQKPEQIISSARKLIEEASERGKSSEFVRSRLDMLGLLIDMLEDEGWGMQEVGRQRVLAALAYFNDPQDLIPDHIPGLGFLDDAIMIELMARELKPEVEAYRDFVNYREAEANRRGMKPEELNRGDYLKSREQELLSRMRRRRRRGGGGSGGSGKSPFSLF